MKRRAFTLAEVLVTLGIIGVISAMTLPTLTKNHQRKVYVTQLHKVYNEFSQAGESFITSNNAVNLLEAGLNSQDRVNNFVQSQMKTVKNCGSTFTDCFASEYKNMNGVAMTNFDAANSSCYVLPSGASVCLTYAVASNVVALFSGNLFVNLLVDVNGKQGPNILGRDLFFMGMHADGSIGRVIFGGVQACKFGDDDCMEELNKTDLQRCQGAATMTGRDASMCFGEILNNGWQMEY